MDLPRLGEPPVERAGEGLEVRIEREDRFELVERSPCAANPRLDREVGERRHQQPLRTQQFMIMCAERAGYDPLCHIL